MTAPRDLPTLLRHYGACGEAVLWARDRRLDRAAWEACERGDWLLWIAARLGVDRRLLVAAGVARDEGDVRLERDGGVPRGIALGSAKHAGAGLASGSHAQSHSMPESSPQHKIDLDTRTKVYDAGRMTYRVSALAAVRTAATRAAILEALTAEAGDVGRTATRLGLSRPALYHAAQACDLRLGEEAKRLRPA